MTQYSTNLKISYVLYIDQQMEDGTIQHLPVSVENKNVAINLEADNPRDAKEEIEAICDLVVNKSNQAKTKIQITS